MNLEGIRPPSAFLPSPGRPSVPWETWKTRFHTYLLATGGDAFAPERKRAILLHYALVKRDNGFKRRCPLL